MVPRNCLTFTLDRLHEQGGYVVARKSGARGIAHVMHVGTEGLQHFSPGAPLGHPFSALVGFDGVVWDREMADAPPMSVRAIIVSAWICALTATVWGLARKLRRAR